MKQEKIGDFAINEIYNIDCLDGMHKMPDNCVDLVVTSPPYDNLRDYNGFCFDFQNIAKELYRVMKPTGVVVWVVGDKIVKGDKSLTSFKQCIFFQEIGFKVHDIMIYKKKNTPFMRSNAYTNCFEFMFILVKERVATFNPLKTKTVRTGDEMLVYNKKSDGVNKKIMGHLNESKTLTNIWEYAVGLGGSTRDKIAFKHPAIFPEKLASDHITSWSNEGDLIFDPFAGSGTTCKMSKLLNRKYLGFEISKEYTDIARRRISDLGELLL
ncbi:MAG: site-specific DNA-methyltransferase [Paludibacteraceae bacterium]|nr:site-specific DNA-methyltransferase [Paludibacteraceae bacterium]